MLDAKPPPCSISTNTLKRVGSAGGDKDRAGRNAVGGVGGEVSKDRIAECSPYSCSPFIGFQSSQPNGLIDSRRADVSQPTSQRSTPTSRLPSPSFQLSRKLTQAALKSIIVPQQYGSAANCAREYGGIREGIGVTGARHIATRTQTQMRIRLRVRVQTKDRILRWGKGKGGRRGGRPWAIMEIVAIATDRMEVCFCDVRVHTDLLIRTDLLFGSGWIYFLNPERGVLPFCVECSRVGSISWRGALCAIVGEARRERARPDDVMIHPSSFDSRWKYNGKTAGKTR